jgi:hypothetical protein
MAARTPLSQFVFYPARDYDFEQMSDRAWGNEMRQRQYTDSAYHHIRSFCLHDTYH